MPVNPTRRIALVTGGSSGIGFGIVERLLMDGFRVAFCSSDPDRLEVAYRILNTTTPAEDIMALCADVSDEDSVKGMFTDIRDRWGHVDVLVNNAGISTRRANEQPWIFDLSLEDWDRVVRTNLTGTFLCTRFCARDMVENRWGRIINITSLAGRTIPLIAGPHYAASKAGIFGLTRALARDLAPYGVTVNCVAPGRIITPMTGSAEAPVNIAALKRIPVGRFGTPADIAGAVAYYASEDAGFVTAAALDVNGGEFG
ncbi:3-oxoacyl-ACP reductase FabG [Pelagibius litoralis]|uniref:3-oxoacyl-ACP reductase FabG n=2 Tax=Pelagibius litoralis TaxID=374515 RepID=A0A967EZT7_9PROT|nr:3-oxoacyl-ACP reductase FabG [Pelagibius litoralis]